MKIDDILGRDVRTVHRVKWPGTDKDVGLLMLRCSETNDAYFEAREVFRRKGLSSVDDASTFVALEREEDAQECYRMLVDPEAKVADARLFLTMEDARARLDVDLRVFFVDKHKALQIARVASWSPERLKAMRALLELPADAGMDAVNAAVCQRDIAPRNFASAIGIVIAGEEE